MNLNLSFRHIDPTEAIKDKIEQKAQHLTKLIPNHASIDWTCSVEGNIHKSDVLVHAHGNRYHAHAVDDNLYKTFDKIITKLESQIYKQQKA
ncbi:MAG: ribosomal subunit interface protein [Halobacteriovoraceae bacterium]|nr:ribosomal subunit interface protein [Halobacteriovoraceae bacterium]|tara:strand:+ start:3162 stop:3437 length:276 start_codon:yes stop_codon:yes gene_type:complete